MPSQEDIANQQELLAAYRRTLTQYLKQQALISELFTPPAIAHGIDEARENIQRVKSILRDWGVQVDDLPDDEESQAQPSPPAPRPLPALRIPKKRRIAILIGALAVIGLVGALGVALLSRSSSQPKVLRGVAEWSRCDDRAAWVLPSTISPQNREQAREQLAEVIAKEEFMAWPVVGLDVDTIFSNRPVGPRNLYFLERKKLSGGPSIVPTTEN